MRQVKCVAWDLDDTVWEGVAVEAPTLPRPRPRVLELMAEVDRRGILNSVASRSDPSLLQRLPEASELWGRLVAPQIGWEVKSVILGRLADRLNLDLGALALVDEDPFTRAEVRHLTPQVLVLSLRELETALDSPPFAPASLTAEGRQRVRFYQQEELRRRASTDFPGSHLEFLSSCEMRLQISLAGRTDLPRLAELESRTRRLNSGAAALGEEELARRCASADHLIACARLADRFGDYGLVGFAVAARGGEEWRLQLLAVSCRVEGRGVPAALLRWVMEQARRRGARTLSADYLNSGRNQRLGVLYRQLGFRGRDPLRRDLCRDLPPYPVWLHLADPELSAR